MLAPSNSPWLEQNTHTTMLTGFTPRLCPRTSTELSAVLGNPLSVHSQFTLWLSHTSSSLWNLQYLLYFHIQLLALFYHWGHRNHQKGISFYFLCQTKWSPLGGCPVSPHMYQLPTCFSLWKSFATVGLPCLWDHSHQHLINTILYICLIYVKYAVLLFFFPLDPLLSVPSHFCVLVYGEPPESTAYGWCHHFPFSGGPTSDQGPCCTTPLKPPLARHRRLLCH